MFVIDVPFFNLDQIYNSKQVPRWIKLNDSKYIIAHGNKSLKVEQVKERLIMSCTEDDFFNIWFEYFDLRTDYSEVNRRIKSYSRKFVAPSNRGSGIHIINQESFETYVLCKLAQYVGWEKVKQLMIAIAEKYGIKHVQAMREAGKQTWYEWPSPESLLEQLEKEDSNKSKTIRFLKKLCNAIVYDDYAYTHNGNDAFNLLYRHDMNIFPILGIEQTIEKNFKCDAERFEAEHISDMKYKGVAYMYILHHTMNPPKEVQRWV